jgi:hypothetical protein
VRATDSGGLSSVSEATVHIDNAPPGATFDAPASAVAGFPFELSLTSPDDPSGPDDAAGFTYAFDCGSGYGPFTPSNTATCTASSGGSLGVGGKIRDKDNGVSEYRETVPVADSAQNLVESVLADVQAAQSAATKPDSDKLPKVVDALGKALDADLWIDPNHVRSPGGDKVFDRLKDASSLLNDLIKDKKGNTPDATLRGWIDDLEASARLLARTAIDDAIAAGAPANNVAAAENELAKGDAAAAKGDIGTTFDKYKTAWLKAQDALRSP